MRIFSFLIVMAMVQHLMAANIQWDTFSLVDMGGFAKNSYMLGADGHGELYPEINLIAAEEMGHVRLQGNVATDGAMGAWLLLSCGDVLDAQVFAHAMSPLAERTPCGAHGNSSRVDLSSDFFLGFRAEKITSDWPEDWDGDWMDPRLYAGEYVYGWVHLSVNEQGRLMLQDSAMDLDGGPMVVGGGSATPEPSGALLLLLGLGALGLRRPRSTSRAISLRTARAAPRRNPLRRTLPQGRMK